MTTKAGKVQLKDIRQGKTFYLVRADFPIIGPGIVGEGEVEMVRRIRIVRRPFWRSLSATPAFTYIDDRGREDWINPLEMEINHQQDLLTNDAPYFVVLGSYRAMKRFIANFDNRKPNKDEVLRTLLREANLNTKQRGLT
jgi:hypothetical protein